VSRDDKDKNRTNFEVDVSPDMGMYRILPQQGYNPAFALAEFIDNAIHAFQHSESIEKPKTLSVTLNFYTNEYDRDTSKRNSIEIIDNGPGMLKSELARAFKPAKKPIVEGLSEFGIGMKAAAVWFTDTWQLVTKNIHEPEYHTVSFDLPKLLDKGQSTILVNDSENYSINHGVVVTLKDIRSRRYFDKSKVEAICQTISEIYQKYTREGEFNKILELKASIDGDNTRNLIYSSHADNTALISEVNKLVTRQGKKTYYAIGNERRWFKKIDFDYTYEGVTSAITGFIYILKTARYGNKNQGLIYFRNGRVIVGTHEKENKPEKLYGTNNKYRGQRLYGELNIDGLPVTYTKDGIDFDEDVFIEKLMEDEEVALFIQQCETHRADINDNEINHVNTEADIPPPSNKKPEPSKQAKGKSKPAPKKKTKKKSKSQRDMIFEYLIKLKDSDIATLGIRSFIEELRYQIVADRAISATLSLRVVLEKGILERIQKDFLPQYNRVEQMGIQALVNYMSNNKGDFFVLGEEKAFKCAQANSKSRQFDNVLVLNSVGHGSFNPDITEVETIISNLQPLLDWAYKT